MHCDRKEVRDVFLSQGIDETEKQDVFIGPVLSIKPNAAFGDHETAGLRFLWSEIAQVHRHRQILREAPPPTVTETSDGIVMNSQGLFQVEDEDGMFTYVDQATVQGDGSVGYDVSNTELSVSVGDGHFHVTMEASDWVMLSQIRTTEIEDLHVGDVVRIGSLSNNRAMDYTAQVIDKVVIKSIANGCVCPLGATDAFPSRSSPLQCPQIRLQVVTTSTNVDHFDLAPAVVPKNRSGYGQKYARDGTHVAITEVKDLTDGSLGRPLYAYKLSVAADWTRNGATFPYTHLQPVRSATDQKTLVEMRHLGTLGALNTPQRPYPMYKMRTFSSLRTSLGQDIKHMDWIKLIGYSVDDEVTSSQVHRGNLHLKQWVAVHVKGLIGTTISNEPAAHGAFAVLHCADKIGGGVHMHDSKGLHVRDFNGGSPLRELHLDFKTATGEPAKLRGIHLWFQICTSHG